MTKTKSMLCVLAFLLILILDQGTKHLAAQVTINSGVSFGLFPSNLLSLFLIGIWILLILVMGRHFFRLSPVATGVFFGASASNLLDRLLYGGVRDFLFVPILNVQNNVADWAILLALGFIVLKMNLEAPKPSTMR